MKPKSNRLIGIGGLITNLVENWPYKDCLAHAHIQNILAELKSIPVPDKVIYVASKSDHYDDKHQKYIHVFVNLKHYGFARMEIHYLDEKDVESHEVNGCEELLKF